MVKKRDKPVKDMSPKQFLKHLDSLPDDLKEEFHRLIISRPDDMAKAVKTLREIATNPDAPKKVRERAIRTLKAKDFDDESLKRQE